MGKERIERRCVLAAALGALVLAGCGEGSAPPPSSTSTPPAADAGPSDASGAATLTQADLDKVAKAAKPYKVVLIVKTRNNPFFEPMIRAFEEEAKLLGIEAEVQAPQQETDKEKQFALVQDVTARGVQAIVIAPADSKGIVPALKQAQDKGVLVVNLDNRVDAATAKEAGLELAGYVGADNKEGGKLAGQALVEALGTGQVAVLEGIRGADNAEARRGGFEEAISGKLDVRDRQSAEWDTQKAYAKMQGIIATIPDLKGLFCANDKMALGAMKALKESDIYGQVKVIGYDNIPDVRPYLENGEMYATIEQHPDLMGKYGLRMAIGVLDGTVAKGGEFLVPLELIKGKAPAPGTAPSPSRGSGPKFPRPKNPGPNLGTDR
jgi:ribose transport system substrate-binding protein